MKVFKIRIGHSGQPEQKVTGMDRKFIDEVVAAHNTYRSRHQVPPLTHSRDLSATAQKWADHLAASNTFQHSNSRYRGDHLGENIAMKWSSRADAYTGQEVTDQWYSEVKMYTFGGEPRSLNSGHFTQVVWKGSREIGIGKSVTRDGKILVVANYLPTGNMIGEYTYNVLPPRTGNTLPETQPKPRDLPRSSSGVTPSPSWGNNNNNINITSPGSDSVFSDFDDMRNNLFGRGGSKPNNSISTRGFKSSGERRSIRTFTVTEGHGANKVTKVIEEETITKPNGEIITNRKETVQNNNDSGDSWSAFSRKPFDSTRDEFDGFGRRLNISNVDNIKRREPSKNFYSNSSDLSPDTRRAPKTMSEFIDGCVKEHNNVRAKHGVQALKHSTELSGNAQKWAEYLASTDGFQHSSCSLNSERIGENIACKWSSGGADYSSKEVVDQWYSEISKHDYSSERSLGTGHYTQVVWKGSRELGIGKARAAGGKIIVVANYRPVGNVVGHFRENVFPPH